MTASGTVSRISMKTLKSSNGGLSLLTWQNWRNESGKLISITGADNGCSPVKQTFQWQGNDIAAVTDNNYTNEITYSSIIDKFNVDLTGMIIYGDFTGKISTAMIRFKGTTSEHLPQMFDGIIFSYELDSDGCVTTIKESGEPIYYIEYVISVPLKWDELNN